MAYDNLSVEREDDIAIITVNRPKVLNALNRATLDELARAIDELAADAAVKALIVTGAGDRAFVAGADINELRALDGEQDSEEFAQVGQNAFYRLEQFSRPVIAAINGYALGGGCELALAADIRIAADTAQLGQPEINLGLIPGYGGTQRLPRLIGKSAAKLLILSGDRIGADEALRLGLVDRVVPAAELMTAARELARKLAGKAPLAVAAAKKAINLGMERELERGIGLEASLFGQVCDTADRVEGTTAYLEKRKPTFKGE